MRQPRRRNSTRDRDIAELSKLRGLVLELETHLVALQRGGQLQSQPHESSWRGLSQRQARLTEAAQRTNRALFERVQSNADWIQRLWELLCERRLADTTSNLKKTAELQWQVEDAVVLEQLKQQATSAADKLPDVFAKHGIQLDADALTERWTHVKVGNLQSTLVCVRSLPFDMHSTSAALWAALSQPNTLGCCEDSTDMMRARVLELTPTTCSIKFQEQICLEAEATPADYHAVIQRATVADPQHLNVLVWQSLFVLDDKTRHSDTMWTAIARHPAGGLRSIVAVVCQSQICATSESTAISMQTSVMASAEACIDNALLSAESVLLQESSSCARNSSKSDDSIQTIAV